MDKDEEELDNLFRKGLHDPVDKAGFAERDWDTMEQMLDKGKKRPSIIFWLPVLGSAAAVILVFIGWLFLKPEVVKPQHVAKQAVNLHHNNGNTGTSGGPTRQTTNSTEKKLPAYYAKNLGVNRHGTKNRSFFIDTLSAAGGRRGITGPDNKLAANNPVQQGQILVAARQAQVTNPVNNNTPASNVTATDAIANNSNPSPADNKGQAKTDGVLTADSAAKLAAADHTPGLKRTKFKLNSPNNGTQYALGVLASSDVNGVNSFAQTKLGGNFGFAFSATIKKWTISTGAAYSIKPYLTSADNYHTSYVFKTEPTSVYANCRMIDIPLDINYQVYRKSRNKITFGTGLSSYIILREDYKFNYANNYTAGPASYNVINKNHNILGIINLDATYQHQVNSQMGIMLQPYLKLPLSNVGASQVRLQTAGVAVGVSWNLNPFSKP